MNHIASMNKRYHTSECFVWIQINDVTSHRYMSHIHDVTCHIHINETYHPSECCMFKKINDVTCHTYIDHFCVCGMSHVLNHLQACNFGLSPAPFLSANLQMFICVTWLIVMWDATHMCVWCQFCLQLRVCVCVCVCKWSRHVCTYIYIYIQT